ncbi:glycine oxidase ThiO [Streptomyces sp. NPDC048481]|uniref:glycine oxidase ThiO n=1 Tax=Streptomyces sp. NPDC048481 TaxID=3365557 RepID=UPI0037248ED2
MRVIIVGGGVIGLATAWRCAQRGADVTVIDPEPGGKASHVAAGLLPPSGDMLIGEPDFARFVLHSRALYPSFAAEVAQAAGTPVGFLRNGILDVAYDAHAAEGLDRLRQMADGFGVRYRMLTPDDCHRLEPHLAAEAHTGMLSPDDGSIDPRALTRGLTAALQHAGGHLVRERAARLLLDTDTPAVRLSGGALLHADRLVLAAGPWTHLLPGLPDGLVPEIKPYKGQVIRLHGDATVHHTVRCGYEDRAVYIAPRTDGELAVGATYEDTGYDEHVRAEGVADLLERVRRVLPAASRMHFAGADAGLRPGSPDGRPILGPTSRDDVLLATGHHRVGVQLTPATAEAMAEAVVTGRLPQIARPFGADRFASTVPTAA